MLPVSSAFHAAEKSDVNKIAALVYLVLGNYASAGAYGTTITSSGDDASGNYPAAGAIDGDRTEINVGPASGADNNIGKSSWRSAVAPSVSTQNIRIDLTKQRTINRIKVYHLNGHGLKKFKLAWSNDDSSYTDFAATPEYGLSVAKITTTFQLDTIEFSDLTARYIKLVIDDTQVAGEIANVVELEIYRKVNITDYVIGVKIDRRRDYKLGNALASSLTLDVSNYNRFFSISHVPASGESTSGFVNSELAPNIGVIVKLGFDFVGSLEYAQQFVGTIDSIQINPGGRTATISARDDAKKLFNITASANLKSNQDIQLNMQYLLNLANVSNYEMTLDNTTIVVDYFFTNQETIITTMRNLVQACGDAVFYYDENGIATFKDFLNTTPQGHTDTTEADFELGTLTNIDTTSAPGSFQRKWFLIDDFSDLNYASNPAWTVDNALAGWSASAGALAYSRSGFGTNDFAAIHTPLAQVSGTWRWNCSTHQASDAIDVFFMAGAYFPRNSDGQAGYQQSYKVSIGRTNASLYRTDGTTGAPRLLGTASYADAGSNVMHEIRVTRDSNGQMKVYNNGALLFTATDTVITGSTNLGVMIPDQSNAGASIDDVHYSNAVDGAGAVSTAEATLESQVIDQSSGILSEGIFESTFANLVGTSISWFTATSADGVAFDSYVAVSPGSAIASAKRRYIKYKAVLNCPIDDGLHNANVTTPTIYDATPNWFIGAGSVKYPSTISFTITDDDILIAMVQEYSDSLGGDTSVVNYVNVQAQPLILTGTNTDTQWQGTTQTPPVPISAANALAVTNGQVLTYAVVVPNGMDTSLMSGASPAAAVVTFAGGATGTWVFSKTSPTRPILKITITNSGSITDLRVVGKSFTNKNTIAEQISSDTPSINIFGTRQITISNQWVISNAIALSIANRLVSNFKNPTQYIPSCVVRPLFSVQIGDRVAVKDDNLDLNADYIVIGVNHSLSAQLNAGQGETDLVLLKVV